MSPRLDALRALPPPLLCGHRGVRGARAENTIAAIRLAAEEGADGVEIDVRPCKSGELVVIHDADLARVTGGRDRRRVADLALRDLEKIELAEGDGPPSLRRVLELTKHLGLALNVELKRDVPWRLGAVRALVRELARTPGEQAIVVSSFDPAMLLAFRALDRATPTALLVEPVGLARHLERGAQWFGRFVHPEHTMVTGARLARWKHHGLTVVTWTVNDAAEIERLLALGVDGIITDVPSAARPLVERARAARPKVSQTPS